jgi:hypothetical protein
MISSTKRRLVSLASASAIVATMSVATTPAATFAADGDTVVVKGTTLRAMYINPTAPVTGTINADGYDVAVYFGPGHSGTVDADISGATWYGVVADGANVTVTGSQIHDIGENPDFNGVQHGNAIFYYNGASGTISGNQVFDFQKNGITVSGKAANYVDLSTLKTSATVSNNIVTGEGPVDYIAQNGIQISYGASATVVKNTVRDFRYNGEQDAEACGLLLYRAGRVNVQNNNISSVSNQTPIYQDFSGGHVRP